MRPRYLVERAAYTVVLLWVVLTALFFLFRLMPGDFADLMLASGSDPASVREFEEAWGLNDPLYVQYVRYLVNFVQLDTGTSIQYRTDVWEFTGHRILNTMVIAIPGITLGYVVGTVAGTVLGSRRDTRLERYGVIALVALGSFPGFFVAIVFVIVFAVWLGAFPTSGMITSDTLIRLGDAPYWRRFFTPDFAAHAALPVSVIVVRFMYAPAMVMRTSVVEVTGQDFIYYNRVTGLPAVSRLKHVARHAILPVITLFPLSMTRAISGLVLIELVFNWPGIGFTLVEAVLSRDYPVVQFVFFLTAALVIVSNFAVDILYGVVDPRVSIGEGGER